MLILNPEIVRFESHAWDDVAAIAIDRAAKRLVEDHGDEGPFAAFADVPEQTVTIRVQRRLGGAGDDTDDPALGASGQLTLYTARAGADASRRRITITCVVTAIRCDLPAAGRPATKTITFIAQSEGASDPVTVADAALTD